MDQAIYELWCRLPVELRRRTPKGRELAQVAQWVQEACDAGAVLEEAMRVTGLTAELFTLARPIGPGSENEEIGEIAAALLALRSGDVSEIQSVYERLSGLRKHRLPDLPIEP